MGPQDGQVLIAKILFFLFAFSLFCLSRAKTAELPVPIIQSHIAVATLSK